MDCGAHKVQSRALIHLEHHLGLRGVWFARELDLHPAYHHDPLIPVGRSGA